MNTDAVTIARVSSHTAEVELMTDEQAVTLLTVLSKVTEKDARTIVAKLTHGKLEWADTRHYGFRAVRHGDFFIGAKRWGEKVVAYAVK